MRVRLVQDLETWFIMFESVNLKAVLSSVAADAPIFHAMYGATTLILNKSVAYDHTVAKYLWRPRIAKKPYKPRLIRSKLLKY